MITDSVPLRQLLGRLLPGLVISKSPSPSGQRVVYFCHFNANASSAGREKLGQVVLKVSEGISASQIAYLEKEILILNSLKSKHYPRLLLNGAFTEDPLTSDKLPHRLFVTIEERINAEPLRALVGRYRDERAVIELLCGLVESLEPLWTHHLKLVHRDLKPENILIRPSGEVAIIDLGIVREEGAKGVTLTLSPFGPCTPHYASPEQAKNDKLNISFKSDFFSLGVLAYELVSGSPPFGAFDLDYEKVLENVVGFEPPTLETLGKASRPFSGLVCRMMQKEPYKRHRTIELLKADIAALKN